MARLSMDDVLAQTADEPATPAPPPPAPARELRSKTGSGTPGVPDSGSSEEPEAPSPEAPAARSAPGKPKKTKARKAPEGPKFATLERKDTLLWPEQVSGLTDLRRDLQRRKRAAGGGGERITENTLIRVAVAALLEHRDTLTGVDETELRDSLTSALRKSRTSEVRDS